MHAASDESPLLPFVHLNACEPSDVVEFARNYGLLDLCEHGNPGGFCIEGCEPWRDGLPPSSGRAPLEAWYGEADYLHDVLSLPGSIVRPSWMPGATQSVEYWRAVFQLPASDAETTLRRVVEHLANWCFQGGRGLMPVLSWDDGPQLRLRVMGLAGRLAFDLLRRLLEGGIGRTIRCFHCDRLEERPRRPRGDHTRHWCRECRRARVPDRYRMQEMRARRR